MQLIRIFSNNISETVHIMDKNTGDQSARVQNREFISRLDLFSCVAHNFLERLKARFEKM